MNIHVCYTALTFASLLSLMAFADPSADAYRQAHTHLAAHRYTEAATLFQTAAATTNAPAAAAAWLGRGESLYGAGQWEAAIAAYDTLLNNFPASPFALDALCSRGFAEHRAGQLQQALATFGAFKSQYPNHALTPACTVSIDKISHTLKSQALQQAVAEATRELATINAFMRDGQFTEAHDASERFLKTHPEHPQAAELSYLAATCDYRAKEYARAAEAYRVFLDRQPQHARFAVVREQLADCLFQTKRYEDARRLYEEIARDTSDPQQKALATLALGDCHAAQQRWSEAERLYLSVEVLQGCEALRPTSLSRLAELYDRMGQPDKARHTREDLRRRYPK